MSTPFHSLLAEDIQSYLDFKRATGRKFNTEAGALRLLDHFLFKNTLIDRTALTPLLVESFLASRQRTRPRSFNHLLGVLRCFFSWAVTQGRLAYSPVRVRPRLANSRRLPFLFKPRGGPASSRSDSTIAGQFTGIQSCSSLFTHLQVDVRSRAEGRRDCTPLPSGCGPGASATRDSRD